MRKVLMYAWVIVGAAIIAVVHSDYATYLTGTDGLFLGLTWSFTMLSIREIK